jgi:hypothetical protein
MPEETTVPHWSQMAGTTGTGRAYICRRAEIVPVALMRIPAGRGSRSSPLRPREESLTHTSVLLPEVAVALQRLPLTPESGPNGVPTRVPAPASWCPLRWKSEYAVHAGARPCTSLQRPGNAVGGVTRHERSNPSRSEGVVVADLFGHSDPPIDPDSQLYLRVRSSLRLLRADHEAGH